jgi:hypothetical protein
LINKAISGCIKRGANFQFGTSYKFFLRIRERCSYKVWRSRLCISSWIMQFCAYLAWPPFLSCVVSINLLLLYLIATFYHLQELVELKIEAKRFGTWSIHLTDRASICIRSTIKIKFSSRKEYLSIQQQHRLADVWNVCPVVHRMSGSC